MEASGKCECVNHSLPDVTCEMEFLQRGWTSASINTVTGIIKGPGSTAPVMKLAGRFTESLTLTDMRVKPNPSEVEIWRAATKPEKAEWLYNFAHFSL